MNRRDCIKIGAASVAGLVFLAGCMGPGDDEEEEDGGGEGEGGEGGEDKIETDRTREGSNAFASPE